MANSIDYASIFQSALDEKMVQELTSRKMEANQNSVKYNGGNEIKILKMELEGLGDYNRNTGFPSGDITTTWETHTFDKDRGKEFSIDAMDNDEGFVDIAGQVMSQFQRVHVAPEVDAYRYSRIFTYALGDDKIERYTPVASTVFEELSANISAVQDIVGENEPLTIYMSYSAANVLDNADKIEKKLEVSDFTTGNVSTKVRALDGVPIMKVPAVRFKSEYTFSATDGFSAPATASAINWMIVADRAVIGIVKTDKVRTFSPEVNQDADAWKMQYRKYHTLIIPDNKLDGLYVSHAGVAAPALTATVAGGSAGGTTKFTATAGSGNALGYILAAAASDVKYLDLMSDLTGAVYPYTSGADITASAGQYLMMIEYDSTTGRVEKTLEELLESGDIT